MHTGLRQLSEKGKGGRRLLVSPPFLVSAGSFDQDLQIKAQFFADNVSPKILSEVAYCHEIINIDVHSANSTFWLFAG